MGPIDFHLLSKKKILFCLDFCLHAYTSAYLFNLIKKYILFYPFDFHCMDKNNKTILKKQKKSIQA